MDASLLGGLLDAQNNPATAVLTGSAGIVAATALLRIIRRIRRILWTVTTVALAGTLGVGGGTLLLNGIGHAL